MAQPAHTPLAPEPIHDAAVPLDWKTLEAPYLRNHVQLTSRDRFIKAGESYFSPDGNWIIFQAVEVPKEGAQADPFYAMYVARLKRDRFTGLIDGLDQIERISPDHSANTCGWFHPTQAGKVLFGSTLKPPTDEHKSGFQVGTRRYVWMFPEEMEVTSRSVLSIFKAQIKPKVERRDTGNGPQPDALAQLPQDLEATPVFTRPNYDAECSYSPDGRFILYAHIEDRKENERPDANIYVFDTLTKEQRKIVKAPGYDGGPFFSPDGKSICYRSDRKGDDLLQLFVADLTFSADGVPTGISREYQLTSNEHVNWCPFWHPSATFMVYGTSEVSHSNYEVFAIESDMKGLRAGRPPSDLKHIRITQADGADILPAFSPDGALMIWTSQRGPKVEGEEKASSQLWIADWVGDPFKK